jgi:hypothetical protein
MRNPKHQGDTNDPAFWEEVIRNYFLLALENQDADGALVLAKVTNACRQLHSLDDTIRRLRILKTRVKAIEFILGRLSERWQAQTVGLGDGSEYLHPHHPPPGEPRMGGSG